MANRPVLAALAVAALLVATGISDNAQAGVELGFKGGLNIASVSGELEMLGGIDDFSSRMALGLGAYLTINITDMFAVQPEVLFMQRGGKIDEFDVWYEVNRDLVEGTLATEAKHTYIEIPVLAKLSVPTNGGVTPYFVAGPAMAFNMNAENEMSMEIPSLGWSETETEDDEDITGFDFGLVFGAGLGIPAGPGEVAIDGRYTLGLTNLIEDGDADNELKSRVFSFTAGYSFPLGGD